LKLGFPFFESSNWVTVNQPCASNPQIVDDAAKFISKDGHDTYDAIIVDSSDPVGACPPPSPPTPTSNLTDESTPRSPLTPHRPNCWPRRTETDERSFPHANTRTHTGPAEALFAPEFFEAMRNALNPGGIICTQAECQWLHLDFIAKVYRCVVSFVLSFFISLFLYFFL
jgi:hypothetical protein